jgi:hypothetical protein
LECHYVQIVRNRCRKREAARLSTGRREKWGRARGIIVSLGISAACPHSSTPCTLLDGIIETRDGKREHRQLNYSKNSSEKHRRHEGELHRSGAALIILEMSDPVVLHRYCSRIKAVSVIGVVSNPATDKPPRRGLYG